MAKKKKKKEPTSVAKGRRTINASLPSDSNDDYDSCDLENSNLAIAIPTEQPGIDAARPEWLGDYDNRVIAALSYGATWYDWTNSKDCCSGQQYSGNNKK
jgi:hypothetical protein